MVKFYLDIGWRMLVSLQRAIYFIEALVGVVLFLVLLWNKSIAKTIENWDGINPRWAIVPIAFVFVHFFLKAVYDKYRELEKRLPNLSGAIEVIVTSDISNSVGLLITMSVKNLGLPSAAHGFQVFVKYPGQSAQELDRHHFNRLELHLGSGPSLILDDTTNEGPSQIVQDRDFIYNKTMSPLQTGEIVRGVLFAWIRGMNKQEFHESGAEIVVQFFDIADTAYRTKPYAVEVVRKGWKYFPGAHFE